MPILPALPSGRRPPVPRLRRRFGGPGRPAGNISMPPAAPAQATPPPPVTPPAAQAPPRPLAPVSLPGANVVASAGARLAAAAALVNQVAGMMGGQPQSTAGPATASPRSGSTAAGQPP